MKISVGIIARNEEETIGETLETVYSQSIFSQEIPIQVCCIANGCRDSTVDIAKKYGCEVFEINEPSKINAWNHFVHEFSNKDADYLFLLDADIELQGRESMMNMLNVLSQNPDTVISTDLPINHLFFKKNKNLIEKFSVLSSQITRSIPAQVTGQFYCMKGGFARKLSMPRRGFLADDAFIKEMAVTNFLQENPKFSRIQRAEKASHVFTAYTKVKDIFNHQVREKVARTTIYILINWLKEQGIKDPGSYISEKNRQNPDWFYQVIQDYSKKNKYWTLFPGSLTSSFHQIKNLPVKQKILYLPYSLIRFCWNLPICIIANNLMYKQDLEKSWKEKK